MPVSGILMGYYGGKGLPFFYTTIKGAEEPNKSVAGNAFSVHKQLGVYGKYLLALHPAAAIGHAARGEAIFARINPFTSKLVWKKRILEILLKK